MEPTTHVPPVTAASKPPPLRMIPVYAELMHLAGSPGAALLLSQILFWWRVSGRRAFYKFNGPAPQHPAYREGDSWMEETGLPRGQFEGARKRLAVKVTIKERTRPGTLEAMSSLVAYWTSEDHRTWYWVNEARLEEIAPRIFRRLVLDEKEDEEAGAPEPEGTHSEAGTAETVLVPTPQVETRGVWEKTNKAATSSLGAAYVRRARAARPVAAASPVIAAQRVAPAECVSPSEAALSPTGGDLAPTPRADVELPHQDSARYRAHVEVPHQDASATHRPDAELLHQETSIHYRPDAEILHRQCRTSAFANAELRHSLMRKSGSGKIGSTETCKQKEPTENSLQRTSSRPSYVQARAGEANGQEEGDETGKLALEQALVQADPGTRDVLANAAQQNPRQSAARQSAAQAVDVGSAQEEGDQADELATEQEFIQDQLEARGVFADAARQIAGRAVGEGLGAGEVVRLFEAHVRRAKREQVRNWLGVVVWRLRNEALVLPETRQRSEAERAFFDTPAPELEPSDLPGEEADSLSGEGAAMSEELGAVTEQEEPGVSPAGEAEQVWRAVLVDLQGQMTRATFEQWLAGTRLVRIEAGVWVIGAKRARAAEVLTHRLGRLIRQTLAWRAGDACTGFVVEMAPPDGGAPVQQPEAA